MPTTQNSPILGCIFDSVFNTPDTKNTVLTVMMGGEWYDQYIGNKSKNEVYQMAFNQLKKHLKFNVEPDYYEMTTMKVKLINLETLQELYNYTNV